MTLQLVLTVHGDTTFNIHGHSTLQEAISKDHCFLLCVPRSCLARCELFLGFYWKLCSAHTLKCFKCHCQWYWSFTRYLFQDCTLWDSSIEYIEILLSILVFHIFIVVLNFIQIHNWEAIIYWFKESRTLKNMVMKLDLHLIRFENIDDTFVSVTLNIHDIHKQNGFCSYNSQVPIEGLFPNWWPIITVPLVLDCKTNSSCFTILHML